MNAIFSTIFFSFLQYKISAEKLNDIKNEYTNIIIYVIKVSFIILYILIKSYYDKYCTET